MTDSKTEFNHTLRQRGFRVTPQRQLIIEAVGAGKGHSTPDQVYRRVLKKAPTLNRATVYRALEFLASQHFIASTDVGTGSKVYEVVSKVPHHHLVCEHCSKVEQISYATMNHAFKQIERNHGFKVRANHLALFGLCAECQKASHP